MVDKSIEDLNTSGAQNSTSEAPNLPTNDELLAAFEAMRDWDEQLAQHEFDWSHNLALASDSAACFGSDGDAPQDEDQPPIPSPLPEGPGL